MARNVVERSPLEFFKVLDYEQYAPPLFLVIQKFNTWWMGVSEMAFRFFPLIAALISLYLIYVISKRFLQPGIGMFMVFFLFAFSEYYLHFGTEGKQYASDVMIALLLLNEALKISKKSGKINWWKWSVGGALVIWLSMPSVFILAGVGVYFLWLQFRLRKKTGIIQVGVLILSWLLSFGLYYFLILKSDVEKDALRSFHDPYFLPIFPTSVEEITKVLNILQSVMSSTIGHTVIALTTGIIGLVAGIWVMFKSFREELLLFLIPVAAVFFASALQQYSLIPRLTLFFTPILILVIGIGLQQLMIVKMTWSKIIFSILIIGTLAIHDGVKYLWKPYEIEEVRRVLIEVEKEQHKGDFFYISHNAKPAFYFYTQLHRNRAQFSFENTVLGDWRMNPEPADWTPGTEKIERVWVIYSHLLSDHSRIEQAEEMSVLLKSYKVESEVNFKGAQAILLVRKG